MVIIAAQPPIHKKTSPFDGAWENRLLLLCMAKRHDEFLKVFDFAAKKFRDRHPNKEMQILFKMILYSRQTEKTVPQAVAMRFNKLLLQTRKPPRIVLENLPG